MANADSSLASPSKARLRASLGMTIKLGNPTSRNRREKWGTPLLLDLNSPNLLSAYGAAMAVAHFVAFEVFDVVDGPDGVLAAGGMGAGVPVVGMEMIIDVAVKTLRTVEPGADAEEDSAGKPLRAVVAVGSAVVGRDVVVAIGTDGRGPNFDGYLSLGSGSGHGEADCGYSCQDKKRKLAHLNCP
jgi:hypothetical protein